MKAETKNRLMVWAIAVFALMNISTLVTIIYHQHQSDGEDVNQVTEQKQLEANSERFSG